MTNILLIDIDHTISDAAWRDNMITSNTDWDAYHLAGKEDKPIQEIINLVDKLAVYYQDAGFHDVPVWYVIAITARPEKWRQQTFQWMLAHGVSISEILMRPDDSYKSAPEMKIDLLRKRFGNNLEKLAEHNVIFIDDNEKVIEAMRGLGLTTMHISVAKRKET